MLTAPALFTVVMSAVFIGVCYLAWGEGEASYVVLGALYGLMLDIMFLSTVTGFFIVVFLGRVWLLPQLQTFQNPR